MRFPSVAADLKCETGWRTVTAEPASGGFSLRFHHVFAWGLILERPAMPAQPGIHGTFVPLSMSGEVLSDREGYLGVVDSCVSDDEAVAAFVGDRQPAVQPRDHDFDRRGKFGRWACRRCGAYSLCAVNVLEMENGGSWDCDIEVVRAVMGS